MKKIIFSLSVLTLPLLAGHQWRGPLPPLTQFPYASKETVVQDISQLTHQLLQLKIQRANEQMNIHYPDTQSDSGSLADDESED